MVIASARSPRPAGVGVIGEIAQDYGWKLLASGKTEFEGSAVAPATRAPLGEVGRTANSCHAVHVGPVEVKRAP